MPKNETLRAYLGQHNYVELVDGQIKLYTEDIHRGRTFPIFLDAKALAALNQFAERVMEGG